LDPARRLENLSLVFQLSPAQRADRDALVAEISRPGSPSYHKWLTPEDYAARFGARPEDIARAGAWLESQGLEVSGRPSPLGARVTFSGTVARLEAAFRTEMHRYQVGGETHYAMSRAPSVPTDLADVVLAIHNTHDFYPRHGGGAVRAIPDAQCPSGGLCSGNGIGPSDWATIYDVKSLYSPGLKGTPIDGTGVTIAIVGITQIAQADINAFRTRYGLPASTITMTLVPGTGAAQADNGAGIEAILDTEWAGAIAPKATINYVFTGANDGNVDDATFYAIEQNLGDILSESWGGCEQGLTLSDADIVQTFGSVANLLGMTYLASSGDRGAADCRGAGGLYVNIPAAYPGVTSVGGTGFAIPGGLTFDGSGNVTARGTETVWNESDNPNSTSGIAQGGGGISSIFTRPSYQSGVPTCTPLGSLPTGVTASSMREVPDVALTAASGGTQYGYFVECTLDASQSDCAATGARPIVVEIGGTSASTPAFAGVIALARQATGGRLGNINPLLYTLQASTPSAFHDITAGNNEVVCQPGTDMGCPSGGLYGFAAQAGYDCASGLGSIDATNLVTAWATLAPTATSISPSVTATSEGKTVTLQATVDVSAPNTSALGGQVTFAFESYLANGTLDLSWTIGTAPIMGGTTTSGTATLAAVIPPGLVQPTQAVDLVAMYGGDTHHLASTSAKSRITFAPVTLCITPATTTVAAGGTFTYTSGGGVTPVKWFLFADSTCNTSGNLCSTLDETTGAFKAGTGSPGYALVAAIDADGAETFGEITVGKPTGAAPWAGDAGILTNACCVPIRLCPTGDNCGTVADGCGGEITCAPGCASTETCVSNRCVANPVDAGTDSGTDSGVADGGSTAESGTSADGSTTAESGATDASMAAESGPPSDASAAADSGTSSDGSTMAEAGPSDGGAMGADAGPPGDSGVTGSDAGGPHDAGVKDSGGSGHDAAGSDASGQPDGSSQSHIDAAGLYDASASAQPDATEDGGGSEGGNSKGCACRTAQHSTTSSPALAGLVAVVILGARRRRRVGSPTKALPASARGR
jgi:MYXO-CTERM domain-containing protein